MTLIARGFTKWIVSYLVLIMFIMLLPIFLIAPELTAFDSVMNYLFNNNK